MKYSVVITSVGQIQRVKRCMEKLKEHTDMNEINEVIIIADRANNEVLANLVQLFITDSVQLVLASRLIGRPRAYDIGIRLAHNPVVVLLENGCEVFVNWLNELASEFSPARAWISAKPLEDGQEGHFFMGCSMLHVPTYLELGGFDVQYSPFGFEDLDLINRMTIAGKVPCIVKRASVHHPAVHTTVAPMHCSGISYQDMMKRQLMKYLNKFNSQGINYSDIPEID